MIRFPFGRLLGRAAPGVDHAVTRACVCVRVFGTQARECARKIVATYKLCSEQLSSQDHYGGGMCMCMTPVCV